MIHRAPWSAALVLLCVTLAPVTSTRAGYAMYVWKTGFDATVTGCDEAKLLAWDKVGDSECYTHNWESPESRQWLWDTATRPGRGVSRLFVSDIKDRLEPAFDAGDCSHPEVLVVKQMLLDGHCEVPGVKIHALFATSDVDVSEQDHVPFVVWYNDNCALSDSERFDGVAINNESWNDVKCTSAAAEQAYLDDLQAVADAAALQVNGTLETHYSIGWRWSFCDGVEVDVDRDGTVQPATHHMIDIFDSVDAQVAHVNPSTVANRAMTAGYSHAIGQGKPFYVLSYTNKGPDSECTTTHFPYFCSATWSNPARTDDFLMESIFDEFPTEGIPDALGAIHYFRGVYSTGGHSDWPSYYSGSVEPCATLTFSGLVDFTADDEVSWPAQANATLYEVARAESPRFNTGCGILDVTSSTTVVDQQRPDPGGLFTYLVRIIAPDPSDWGRTSSGQLRTGGCL